MVGSLGGLPVSSASAGPRLGLSLNSAMAPHAALGADIGNGRKGVVFVASDSERGKQTARAIAESIGFDVVDAGGLKNARYLEPLAGLIIYLGYAAGFGTGIAPVWIRKA